MQSVLSITMFLCCFLFLFCIIYFSPVKKNNEHNKLIKFEWWQHDYPFWSPVENRKGLIKSPSFVRSYVSVRTYVLFITIYSSIYKIFACGGLLFITIYSSLYKIFACGGFLFITIYSSLYKIFACGGLLFITI